MESPAGTYQPTRRSTADPNTTFSNNGNQNNNNNMFAGAVRFGDVSAVPVPAAVWLVGSGLIGLVSLSKRKP